MVSLTRRLLHQKRVGHAGTLDPLAEGVLPVLVGRATRLADWVTEGDKEYYAEIQLGRLTTTDDLEGETLLERPVPEYSVEAVEAVLSTQLGEIWQRPPAYSAIKQDGVTAYRRARRGESVELPPRRVRIDAIRLVRRTKDTLAIAVRCGKGTYIRSIARDVGEQLGCGGTVARLVRLRVGRFVLERAVTPDDLQDASRSGRMAELLLAPDSACQQLPALVLSDAELQRALKGQGWPAEDGTEQTVRVYDADGGFLGIARREPDHDPEILQTWWRLRIMIRDV